MVQVQETAFDEDNPKSATGKVHNVNADIELAGLRDKTTRFAIMGSPDLRDKGTTIGSPDLRDNPHKRKDPPEQFFDLMGMPVDKSTTGSWKAAIFIYAVIFADYLATIAIGANMVTYLIFVMHLQVDRSSNIVTTWLGVIYVVTIVWGFLADSYLGRYWTMVITAFLQIFGMVLLTISTSLHSLRPRSCTLSLATPVCPEASDRDLNFLLAALYLMAIGSAGIKAMVPSFGQEQFDISVPEEKRAGIHYFNWYFFCSSMGNLLAYSVMVYVQDQAGRGWGYGILTAVFTIATVVFLFGTPFYRHKKPSGSPLTRIAQVIVAAGRHWNRKLPEDHQDLYELSFLDVDASPVPLERLAHTNKFRFLDKAAIVKGAEIMRGVDPWRLSPVSQIEELKRILLMLPIWVTIFPLFTAITQMSTYVVVQATTMDRSLGKHFQIPAASLGTFSVIGILILTPVYDILFVPFARKFTGHERGITPLQRMSVGFVLALLGLITAALVENRRVREVRHLQFGFLPVGAFVLPMKVFWLVPQLVLIAGIEFFTSVAALEIFHGDAPNTMKSLSSTLTFSSVGIGSLITTAVVTAVNRYTNDNSNPFSQWLRGGVNHGGLSKFYWLLAIVVAVDFIVFLVVAYWYEYKKVDRVETISSSQRYTVLEEARLSNFPENIR